MAIIESTVSPGSEAFEANRTGMLALIERVRGYERRSIASSGKSRERFEKRGQLLPRERLSLLLDPGTPFLEIGSLAGLGLDNPDLEKSVPGGGVIGPSPSSCACRSSRWRTSCLTCNWSRARVPT